MLFVSVVLASAAVGCSSASGDGGGGGGAPAPSATTSTDPQRAVQTGKIVDFDTSKALAGATIDDGLGDTATSAADGTYSLSVVKDTPFSMRVTAGSYIKLLEQQTQLSQDYDRGPTTMVATSLANTLHTLLPHYDATLGVLSVQAIPQGECESEAGAKVEVDGASGFQVVYFQHKIPNLQLTGMEAGELPSAVIYNLPPGAPVTVRLSHPKCKQMPFPVTGTGGITYLGAVTTEAGDATAFQRLFLQ
ncbi:MAG TPA: hypothetical protein VIF15_19165 [Polyangiaceae bacterium]